jgi:hypothetical protein
MEGPLALKFKDKGNTAFALGQHEAALNFYAEALQALEEAVHQRELRSTLHSNRAACHLQLGRFDDCVKVRALDQSNSPTNPLMHAPAWREPTCSALFHAASNNNIPLATHAKTGGDGCSVAQPALDQSPVSPCAGASAGWIGLFNAGPCV